MSITPLGSCIDVMVVNAVPTQVSVWPRLRAQTDAVRRVLCRTHRCRPWNLPRVCWCKPPEPCRRVAARLDVEMRDQVQTPGLKRNRSVAIEQVRLALIHQSWMRANQWCFHVSGCRLSSTAIPGKPADNHRTDRRIAGRLRRTAPASGPSRSESCATESHL